MALVNLSILAIGTLFIAVPIVLHLVMRQRPKHVLFPALRFVQKRREANRRRMRLRHWILLFLRCAAIVVLAAALARPSVAAAAFGRWLTIAVLAVLVVLAATLTAIAMARRWGRVQMGGLGVATLVSLLILLYLLPSALQDSQGGVLGDQQAPIAAALVFDTSSRMQYIHENRSRLEQAQANGLWLLRQLPEGSEVVVLDSRQRPPGFAADRGAAAREIEGLEATHTPLPLVRVLESATALVRQSDKTRKEIYVLTDLTAAGWDRSAAGPLRGEMERSKDVILYVWDVGVPAPRNFYLGQPRLAGETLAQNSALHLQVELLHVGPGGQRTVELQLEEPNDQLPIIVDGKAMLPPALPRGREVVSLEENGSRWLDFSVRGLDVGTYHGSVRILGQDGLSCDDVRYFSVEVIKPWRVLLVSGQGARSTFVADALSPDEFRDTGRARFRCDTMAESDLDGVNLGNYAAVCLLDPGPQPETSWQKIASYVRDGGGLGILLGKNAGGSHRDSFRMPAAMELMPGKLDHQWRAVDDRLYLAPRTFDHAILAPFRQDGASVPWDRSPIYRHWVFIDLASDSNVVVRFGNDQPAIVERGLGRGRVLTMTTPWSDPLHRPGRPAWNELLTGLDAWPSFVLCNEMFMYLVNSGETKLNYRVGQTAQLTLPLREERDRLQLFTPRGDWRELTVEGGHVSYPFTDAPGVYRVKGRAAPTVATGFSANLPTEASRLDRIEPEQLDSILGPGRYRLARSRGEIDRGVGEARVGREFYPYLIVLLVFVLGLETLLANRFYREASTRANPWKRLWPWGGKLRPANP